MGGGGFGGDGGAAVAFIAFKDDARAFGSGGRSVGFKISGEGIFGIEFAGGFVGFVGLGEIGGGELRRRGTGVGVLACGFGSAFGVRGGFVAVDEADTIAIVVNRADEGGSEGEVDDE